MIEVDGTFIRTADAKGAGVRIRTLGGSLATGVLAAAVAVTVGSPVAQAKNGDTHVTGQGITQTLDCNESTLIVMGTGNYDHRQGNVLGA